MRKKLSCHIITYNQKDFISQCIEGALMQQTDFPFELIIGDDNSTDGTREILIEYQKKYPEIITLNLRTERGKGIPGKDNFMSTLEMCKGEYISLCDGDDYWIDPLKLQKQVSFLEANPDYVLCFHQVKILKPDRSIVKDFLTNVPENHETIADLARFGNYIHTPSAVFRNVIPKLPYEFKLSPIGDYFMYMMLAEHGKIKCINEEMAVYRHGVGIFSGEKAIQLAKTSLIMFTCIFSYLTDPKIKQIIFERHNDTLNHVERLTRREYENAFVSKNLFFRLINIVQKNYKYPKKALKKAYLEVFNKK